MRGNAVNRPVFARLWLAFGGGCHVGRDTAAEIEQAGFTIDRLDRMRFPDTRMPAPSSPRILGRAIRPAP